MSVQPNRLGSAMKYITDAYYYATNKSRPAPARNRLMYDMLSNMAHQVHARSTADTLIAENSAIRLAMTCSWFYSGVRLIAERISSSDSSFRLHRRDKKRELEEIKDHPLLELFERPNSIMTFAFVKRYITYWMNLTGNAYIFISTPTPGAGEPAELWPLPSNMVLPLPETLHRSKLTGRDCIDFQYDVNGKRYVLPGENMIHLRFPNPFDYWIGLAPMHALLSPVRTDYAQSRYLFNFFGRDNAVPTAIISLPTEISDTDFELAKIQIREQFGDGRRSAITRAGDLKIETIQQTLQQMELIDARKFNREEINHVLGIPDGLVSGGSSGDSRLSTEITFARNTVQPWIEMIAAELTANLLPYYDDDLLITAPNLIPQDRSLEMSEFSAYSGDRTIEENRKILRLPPIRSLIPEDKQEKLAWIAEFCEIVPIRVHMLVGPEPFKPPEPEEPEEGEDPMADMPPGAVYTDDQGRPYDADGNPMFDEEAPEEGIEPEEDKTGSGYAQSDEWKNGGLGDNVYSGMSPEHQQQFFTGKTAQGIALESELRKWQRVALKERAEGRNPAERVFHSSIIPPFVTTLVNSILDGAEEGTIRALFSGLIQTCQSE